MSEYTLPTKSLNHLVELDLPMPANRRDQLVFPQDLSSIHSDELARHLSYWASMCAYVHFQVSITEGSLVITKQQLEEESDVRLYSKLKKENITATMAKSAVGSSRVVIELKRKIAQMESDLKILKSVAMGYDLKNSAISREISRRQQERNLRND